MRFCLCPALLPALLGLCVQSVGEAVDEGSLLVGVSFDDFDVEIVSEHKGFVAQIKVR